MKEQVKKPLLSDAGPATSTSRSEHIQYELRRRMKAWSMGALEDDQEFMRSAWSRRPYLGYVLPVFFATSASIDVISDGASLTITAMDAVAVVMNALVVPCLDKSSIWMDIFVCAQCMSFSAVYSYSQSLPYYSTAAQVSYTLVLLFVGLRTRYLASAVVIVFVLFDRSTFGLLILAVCLLCIFICGSLVHSFFYRAFSLQRSQDALIQYASDGFCSMSSDRGCLVFACSRFQAVFRSHDLSGRSFQEFTDTQDETGLHEMLQSAKAGRLNQCLVTCYLRDAAIEFDATLIPYQYNHHLDTVDVCLKLQGEVRQADKTTVGGTGVGALRTHGRDQHTLVDIDGTSYHELQVNSSAQQSDDSVYALMWDLVDAAASEDVVRSFGARAVVTEAQQMQSLIFAQGTRAQQRAVARSLLTRCDRIRMDFLRENVSFLDLGQSYGKSGITWTYLAT